MNSNNTSIIPNSNTTNTYSNQVSSSMRTNIIHKHIDPFDILEQSNEQIRLSLRMDEESPQGDLYRRLMVNSSSVSSVSRMAIETSHFYHPAGPCASMIQKEDGSFRQQTSATAAPTPPPATTPSSSHANGIFSPFGNRFPPSSSPSRSVSGSSINATATPSTFYNSGINDPLTPGSPYPNNNRTLNTASSSNSASPTAPTASVKHLYTLPIPSYLNQEVESSTKLTSFLGLLSEGNLVWMSVDDTLYVWSYDLGAGGSGRKNNEDFCSLKVPGGQLIGSVGLVKPKKGVFKSEVKHCLVITTPESIHLCAITTSSSDSSEGFGADSQQLRLIPLPRYTHPTDDVNIIKVIGSDEGRIYMAGDDGVLYELDYEGLLDPEANTRYNDESDLVVKIGQTLWNGGKKALSSLLLSTSSDKSSYNYSRQPKCRKVVHGHSNNSYTYSPLNLLSQLTSSFSTKKKNPILDLAIDQDRGILHTLHANGTITTFPLHNTSSSSNVLTSAISISLLKAVRTYLDHISRGMMYISSSSSQCIFPSGGIVAERGVGSKDDARYLLKNSHLLEPIGLFVITPMESNDLTLVVMTKSGVRLYLSHLPVGGANTLNNTRHGGGCKWTLCHVRSPPPDMETVQMMRGGASPTVLSVRGNVSSGFYHEGLCLMAMNKVGHNASGVQNGGSSSNNNLNPSMHQQEREGVDEAGSVIVVLTADHAKNRTGNNVVNSHVTSGGIVGGGISENLTIFPDPSVSFSSISTTLPGGAVQDIQLTSMQNTNILSTERIKNLYKRSKTPTDSEMRATPPPPLLPPKPNPKPAKRRLSVKARGGIVSTALEYLSGSGGNERKAKRKRDALEVVQDNELHLNETEGYWDTNSSPLPLYQIADNGLSDGSNALFHSVVVKGNASNRAIPSWYLSPKSISLPPQATSLPMNNINNLLLVLNRGGLHVFTHMPLIHQFRNTILQNNESEIQTYFDAYGHVETCSMALTLAVTAGHSDTILSKKAKHAALMHGLCPSMSRLHDSNEYKFQASALHDGLMLTLSRLLRPFWYKPALLVLDPASKNKVRKSLDPTVRRPFKVEMLLDETTLESVRNPLFELQKLMKDLFGRAISVVPGSDKSSGDAMDIDLTTGILRNGNQNGDAKLITTAMQAHHRQSTLSQNNPQNGLLASAQRTPKELDTEARLTEERSIHAHYRILSRTVQLLSMLSILRRCHDRNQFKSSFNEVEWGYLHGLTFVQLVTTKLGQERVTALLSSLVSGTSSPSRDGLTPTSNGYHHTQPSLTYQAQNGHLTPDSDALTSQLQNQCYLYFSHGDGLTYNGFQFLQNASSCPVGSQRRLELSQRGAKLLRMAATHWNTPALVTGGKVMRGDLKETNSFTTSSFAEYLYENGGADSTSSLLVRACDALMKLGYVGGIVDVCLACAANFGGTIKGTAAEEDEGADYRAYSKMNGQNSNANNEMLSWEIDLYHNNNADKTEEQHMLQQNLEHSTPLVTNSPYRNTNISNYIATGTPNRSNGYSPSRNASNSNVLVATSTTPQSNPSSPSPSQMIVQGVEVTSLDARKCCHSILLYHLGTLLDPNKLQLVHQKQYLAETMLSVCAASQDTLFQHSLYEHLLENQHVDILLRISSPMLEQYLENKVATSNKGHSDDGMNHELLWRYYVVHNRHQSAYEVMKSRATTETVPLVLDKRMECLTRAINSAVVALSVSAGVGHDSKNDRSVQSLELTNLEEQLEVAGLQKRILSAVIDQNAIQTRNEQQAQGNIIIDTSNEEVIQRLSTSLLSVSELYNTYAGPMGLYELCLSILLCCRHNDIAAIDTLWRTILGLIMPTPPLASSSGDSDFTETVIALLQSLRNGTPLDKDEEGNSTCLTAFESGDWINSIKAKVISLGKELYGKGADYTFSMHLLVDTLEGFRRVHEYIKDKSEDSSDPTIPSNFSTNKITFRSSTASAWPFQIFVDVGVPYSVIIGTYSVLLGNFERMGQHPSIRIHFLKCIAEILMFWVESASGRSGRGGEPLLINGSGSGCNDMNAAESSSVQLAKALSEGMRSNIDGYKASLEALVGGNPGEVSKILSMMNDVENVLRRFG